MYIDLKVGLLRGGSGHYALCTLSIPSSQWLEEDFLGYVDAWESSVKCHPGHNKTEKGKVMLSPDTRIRLRITCDCMCKTSILFCIIHRKIFHGARPIHLHHSRCEVLLEPKDMPRCIGTFLFDCQRQRGGVHDNPSAREFMKNMQALRVVNGLVAVSWGIWSYSKWYVQVIHT